MRLWMIWEEVAVVVGDDTVGVGVEGVVGGIGLQLHGFAVGFVVTGR